MPRALACLLLMLLMSCGWSFGQGVTDIVVTGVPAQFEGHAFTSRDTLSLASLNEIHTWTGLPFAPMHSSVTLAGSDVMAAPWIRLSDSTALYPSVGADGTAQTADDELTLVNGIPWSPSVVPTGITGVSHSFRRVNDRVAVQASSSGFLVLEHSSSGATVTTVSVPQGLSIGGDYGYGTASSDIAMALSPGMDGIAATADDELVMLRGLEATPLAPALSSVTFSPFFGPTGFVVSEDGAGVAWRSLILPWFDAVVVRPSATFGAEQDSIITRTPSFSSPPNAGPHTVSTVPGGGVVFELYDAPDGTGKNLFQGLDRSAMEVGSWFDYQNIGTDVSVALGGSDVASYNTLGGGSGWVLSRYGVMSSSIQVAQPATWNTVDFLRPNPASVACFSQLDGSPGTAELTLVLDTFNSSAVSIFSTPGRWRGHYAMGPGRVAGFISSTGSTTVAPDVLRIVSLPTATKVSDSPAGGITMGLAPALPSVGQPFTVNLNSSIVQNGTAYVVFASHKADPFVFGGIFLDLNRLIGWLPVTLSSGSGSLTFASGSLAPSLAGVPFYLQSIVSFSGTAYTLSAPGLVVFGP